MFMQFYMEKGGKACSEPLTLQTQKDEAKFVICLSENIHTVLPMAGMG